MTVSGTIILDGIHHNYRQEALRYLVNSGFSAREAHDYISMLEARRLKAMKERRTLSQW